MEFKNFTCNSPVCDHWKLDYCTFHETQLVEGCVCKNHSENVKRVTLERINDRG